MSRVRTTALGSQVLKVDRRLSLAEADALARDIAASDPNVEYAEPDRILRHTFTPNDTRYNEQWHYFEAAGGINAPAAWDKSTGTGVVVAVIDTGYRPHADLAANILPGYDFIGDTFVANDGNGRDSDAQRSGRLDQRGRVRTRRPGRVRSVAAGTARTWPARSPPSPTTGNGVAGIAFNAKIVPARVLGKCGGYTSDIADAIIWASGGTVSGVPANANPAKVLSISLGGSGSCDSTTQNAINSARSRGASVVVAAGNSNANAANFSPANCSGVVTVAAVGRNGGKASYSNFGATVEVAAPGGSGGANSVLSTLNTGTHGAGLGQLRAVQRHVDGDAARVGRGRADAVGEADADAGPGDIHPAEHGARLSGNLLAVRLGHRECQCRGRCGHRRHDAAGSAGHVAEVEPNNSRAASQLVSTDNTTVNGTIGSSSDTDYYRVYAARGRDAGVDADAERVVRLRPVRLQQQRHVDRQQRTRHRAGRHRECHEHRHRRSDALHARGVLQWRHGRDQRQVHAEPELVDVLTAGPVPAGPAVFSTRFPATVRAWKARAKPHPA